MKFPNDDAKAPVKTNFIQLFIFQSSVQKSIYSIGELEPAIETLVSDELNGRSTYFTPERNVHHSRADFFELKREEGESAADVWKRILTIERNCEFETITAVELLASKFLSVIGKSTGDYDLKKKIRKSDMSVEVITDALHEHMYEKLNCSPETEEEKKIRYLN